ncbi:hypothetical protein [Streptomyces sp. NPDC048650]|uniref:hypothetical protein n=1 Tax=unclassified Streptomyces TaxID=2593676 RepID=UPI003711714D
MGSPQLTLCAAVAACVMATAPAHSTDERADGTTAVSVAPAVITDAAVTDAAVTPAPAAAGPATRGALAQGEAEDVPSERDAANRELSSTSAVGLVLAGGALLVVAGQLLRLRLRLRREREGGGSGDES